MLEWNVYVSDFNAREIVTHNVFNHGGLCDDLAKFLRKLNRDKEMTEEQKKAAFLEQLRRDLMYYYWSKCEWEIILDHWPHHDGFREEKIDVFDQVKLNWDKFTEYTWENRKELLKRKS